MSYVGTNIEIAYNIFENLCYDSSDAGALYIYDATITSGGTKIHDNIVRNIINDENIYFNPHGIYLDAGSGGMQVYSNILENVDGFGILSGGPYGPHLHDLYVMDEPQGVSHFLGAIDIAHFIEPAAFKSALSAMSREIKALKKADGVEEIFLPGERSGRKAEENAANGIEVPQPVYEELLELGKPYGLSL